MKTTFLQQGFLFFLIPIIFSCKEKKASPAEKLINEMGLKRGAIISCGPGPQLLGSVDFKISSKEKKVQDDFNLAIKLLHSFEYDEAEKMFAKIIEEDPACAMAYWGVAMSNFHPLWTPPLEEELKKGTRAIEIARSISQKTKKEESYINAIASFYQDWKTVDHRTRSNNFEKAMEQLNKEYRDDKETAVFYALALNAAADPADKTFVKQKKAGAILNALYPGQPDHPGIIHYIIHTYDSPELAEFGLPAARKYATVAPSSAHALHMPSHIFTRMGLWNECINSNLASISSAKCYAEEAGIKGHWDEELHGLDYLVYAYLQKGDNNEAKKQWDYLKTINVVSPVNFKVAYAFAAIPSRYLLENKLWKEAADLNSHRENFSWENYPWQKAIIHFTRLLGNVHLGNINAANNELKEMNSIRNKLIELKDAYKANQVAIQIKASEAWLKWAEKKNEEALTLMYTAADMEEKTEKHPVTPGEVLPARELLGDLLLAMNQPAKALEAYEANLKKRPNRFNGLYSAGLAAEKAGNMEKAKYYYQQLISMTNTANSSRNEINVARQFLKVQ